MPGSDPETNGDLSADIRQLENALARCASQIKMIKHCQDENDAQTRQPAQGMTDAVTVLKTSAEMLRIFVDNGSIAYHTGNIAVI